MKILTLLLLIAQLAHGDISKTSIGVSFSSHEMARNVVDIDFDVYRPGDAGTLSEYGPIEYGQDLAGAFLEFERVVEAGESLFFTEAKAGYSWGILDGFPEERPNGPSENTVNAMFEASFRYGKVQRLKGNMAVVYLVGVDRIHYEGNGGHFMTNNDNDYGFSPEAGVGLFFKFDGKNFILVGINSQFNVDWSERYGNHNTTTLGLFMKGTLYDDLEFDLSYDKSISAHTAGEEREFLKFGVSKSIYENDYFNLLIGLNGKQEKINYNGLNGKEYTFGLNLELRF